MQFPIPPWNVQTDLHPHLLSCQLVSPDPTSWGCHHCAPSITDLPGKTIILYLLQVSITIGSVGKECLPCRRPGFDSWVGKICGRKDRLPTPVFLGFPYGSAGKEFSYNVGDLGSIPGLGISPGEGNGNLLQYSWLENPMDRGVWRAIVHGVARVGTQLSDWECMSQ